MGHVHIGYDDIEVPFDGDIHSYTPDEQRSEIVKVLDLFIGIPSLFLEPDNKRRELYGKAGAYRPKPYGLEYRTPSNFYLSSDELKKWVFDSTKAAIRFLNKNDCLELNLAKHIQNVINSNDKRAAKELITEYKLLGV